MRRAGEWPKVQDMCPTRSSQDLVKSLRKRKGATGGKREVTGTARATARNVCNRDSLSHGEEEKRSIERPE